VYAGTNHKFYENEYFSIYTKIIITHVIQGNLYLGQIRIRKILLSLPFYWYNLYTTIIIIIIQGCISQSMDIYHTGMVKWFVQ